jgi:hypothetical protein
MRNATPAADNAQIYTQPDIVTFQLKNVEPPSAVYLDLDDQIQIVFWYNVTVAFVTVRARILRPDGQITVLEEVLNTPGAYGSKIVYRPVCEGFLLSVAAISNVIGIQDIPPFVVVNVIRGGQTQYQATMNLVADYVTQNHQAGWTSAGSTPRYAGDGFSVMSTINSPAAGADFNFGPPLGQTWRLQSVFARLTTSITAANRIVNYVLTTAPNPVFEFASASPQTASAIQTYSFVPSSGINSQVNSAQLLPLPGDSEISFPATFQTSTTALQAGDQWDKISVMYRGRYSD